MRNKIMLFMLLFAMLVGVGGVVQAKADDSSMSGFYYDSEERVLYYSDKFSMALPDEACALIDSGYLINAYVIRSDSGINSDYYCRFYFVPPSYSFGIKKNNNLSHYSCDIFLLMNDEPLHQFNDLIYSICYLLKSDGISVYQDLYSGAFSSSSFGYKSKAETYFYEFIYSDFAVYKCVFENSAIVNTKELYYGEIYKYSFDDWCFDAGLNCSASSNESDSVVPFWYEPDNYNYIVRKTLTASSTSEVYQVTMLQKTDGSHYPYYFEVNDIGYLGIAGAFSDTSVFTVRNFYYDADGAGWKLVEKFDVNTLPFDNANVTFTDNVVFIYSDCDIYFDRECSGIWQSASTGYYNVAIPEPEISRAPIPSPSIDGVEGFIDTAEGLLDMISVVPLMIGAVFGFLPSWCLAIVGIAFSLLIALVIYKLARG